MEKEELDVKVLHLEKHNKFLERRLKKLEGIIEKLKKEKEEKPYDSPDGDATDFIKRIQEDLYGRKEQDKFEKGWKQLVPKRMYETEDDNSIPLISMKSKGIRDV